MIKKLLSFRDDQDGAVTVDWVVMTAMVVGLALAVMAVFHDGPRNVGESIADRLGQMEPE